MSVGIVEAGLRLALAAVLAGAIGAEREARHKTAGVRTHMLIGFGSALFTVLSMTAFGEGADTSRVAAQIVTGVGFLGAGTIFRQGMSVRNLTTAAGMWAVAAIGMAAGTGRFTLATVSTGVALAVLFAFRFVSSLARGRRQEATTELEVLVGGNLADVRASAEDLVDESGSVHLEALDSEGARLLIMIEPRRADEVMATLFDMDGVDSVKRLTPL